MTAPGKGILVTRTFPQAFSSGRDWYVAVGCLCQCWSSPEPFCQMVLPQEASWAFLTRVSEKRGRQGPCWPCRRGNCSQSWQVKRVNRTGFKPVWGKRTITGELCLGPCMATAPAAPLPRCLGSSGEASQRGRYINRHFLAHRLQ